MGQLLDKDVNVAPQTTKIDNLSDEHSNIDGRSDNLDGSRDLNDEDSDAGVQRNRIKASVTESRKNVSHFSKRLTNIQKRDLKRQYIAYLKEQYFLNKKPKRKEVIESPCEILHPLCNKKGVLLMTNYELIFFYNMEEDNNKDNEKEKSTIFFFKWKLTDTKPY